ncbi:flavodoxin-dependent (E)-4-hydroxy-3-methylbut-2-enyl-diphosphate synthase [Candidatus Omnitrophota bacterium]
MKKRQTTSVSIGPLKIGSKHPIVIQSMTNTPTADVNATLKQTLALIAAGAEMVRLTINDEKAARATVTIIKRLRQKGFQTPIIGDFHFNGHLILKNVPECAAALDKYRINPGNVSSGPNNNDAFTQIIKIAIHHKKTVRIGVNGGSLDQRLLTSLTGKNAKRKQPLSTRDLTIKALVLSALNSAKLAEKIGLKHNKIILSIKTSVVQDMIEATSQLARLCDYPLHLGLTEAGSDVWGITSSAAACGILLQKGIGDTIRVSLTPQPNGSRCREVLVCRALLQSLGFRHFSPTVTSCPGCGRTNSDAYQKLADQVTTHINKKLPTWLKKYKGVEKCKIAVMGCVVNGPGESRHANIGISLPGASEKLLAPVYADGKKWKTLKGKNINTQFITLLEKYIQSHYPRLN